MKKIIPLLSVLGILTLSACQAVPDGSKEPAATIEKVALAGGSEPGFDIDFSIFHRSLEELPLKALDIEVFVNSKKVASFHEEPEELFIRPSVKNTYTRFVKANEAQSAQADSLKKSPMLKVLSSVKLKVTVVEDDEELESYNPVANFEGIISHVH